MTREGMGYYTPEELAETVGKTNTVLDVHSVLISRNAVIGSGNVFYPCVVLHCDEGASLTVGDNNTFYPAVHARATAHGSIQIGGGNLFGDGGVVLDAVGTGTWLVIGDGGRYSGRTSLRGSCRLESGSQVVGNVNVIACTLEAGGTYAEPDPDKRGAVLKGNGVAKNLRVKTGRVINGNGDFAEDAQEPQSNYHPRFDPQPR